MTYYNFFLIFFYIEDVVLDYNLYSGHFSYEWKETYGGQTLHVKCT